MADEYVVKRSFNSLITTGIVAVVLTVIVSLLYWPVWGWISKAVILAFGAPGLQEVDPKTYNKYLQCFAEATFFWMCINAWIWQALVFGGYGKYSVTQRQPGAGLWYSAVGLLVGLIGFFVIVGFSGLWWHPFSFAILFTPQNADEVKLAIEGWEASNFYALPVILANIGYAALFHKWPFAGNIKAPWDSVGAWSLSSYFCLLVWFAIIIPSFWFHLDLNGHHVVSKPMGSWPTFVAYAQCFIWFFLIPAEGGEHYPMKLFAKKQPWMGIIGLIITWLGAFAMLYVVRAIVNPLNLMPGAPPDVPVASVALSIVIATLLWHHVFDDWPTAAMVPNPAARILTRIAIWWVIGLAYGIIWVKIFKMVPYAGTDMGMGYPVMGVLAGQFVWLMAFLYYNTFFDKWPLVRKVPAGKQ
jgi:AAT family amino acid transporter